MDPLYIIDGYGLIFRAYYAFARTPVKNTDGKNVSAIFGFFRLLLAILKDYDPKLIVIALDTKGDTFRNELYPEYKATRQKTPDDLIEQIPLILNFIKLSGIPHIERVGYEADDIIGSLAFREHQSGRKCYIFSSDKDLMQLINDTVFMLRSSKEGGFEVYDAVKVKEEKGVKPSQIIDYLSLLGDSSDNVPGVGGIGEKTACKLLEQYETLENIYDHLDEITPSGLKLKLEKDRENAFLSQKLVSLVLDLAELPSVDSMKKSDINFLELSRILKDQGIRQLSKDLEKFTGTSVQSAEVIHDIPKAIERYDASKVNFSIINQIDQARKVLEKVSEEQIICFDTETDGLNPHRDALVGIALSTGTQSYYLVFESQEGTGISYIEFEKDLRNFFNQDKLWIGQNIKFDLSFLWARGLSLNGRIFDTMIAAWMVNSTMNTYNMDFLAMQYLNYEPISFESLFDDDILKLAKKDPQLIKFSTLPMEKGGTYSAEDAWVTYRLYETLEKKIEEMQLHYPFYEIEMPLIPILMRMEFEGMRLEPFELEQFGVYLEQRIIEVEKELYALVGRPFSIGSTKQLQAILFEERKLPKGKKTKTGYSTDTAVLEELAQLDPVPEKILVYRGYTKLKNTYVDTLPSMLNPKTSRIHTTFSQTGTATGRIASKDPNLQNIPIKDEEGRRIRKAFIAKDGHSLVSADYAQIELVVLAHVAKDPGLIYAFTHGIDVHRLTGSLIWNISPEDVSPAQRRIAKTINFGVMYGMSAFRLAMELKIPRSEASQFIKAYFESYPKIKDFMATCVELTQTNGGIRTITGRFRPIPTILSANHTERQAAERVSVNSPIQGTAADIVKIAMINIDKALTERNLRSKLILQVHDEIILECPDEEIETISNLLKELMPKAVELSVPLGISVETGKAWGDMH